MQREIALSSYALSEALPIMERLMEMRKREVDVVTKATTECNVYKDDSEDTGKLVKPTSTDNSMKHLNMKLHHF